MKYLLQLLFYCPVIYNRLQKEVLSSVQNAQYSLFSCCHLTIVPHGPVHFSHEIDHTLKDWNSVHVTPIASSLRAPTDATTKSCQATKKYHSSLFTASSAYNQYELVHNLKHHLFSYTHCFNIPMNSAYSSINTL